MRKWRWEIKQTEDLSPDDLYEVREFMRNPAHPGRYDLVRKCPAASLEEARTVRHQWKQDRGELPSDDDGNQERASRSQPIASGATRGRLSFPRPVERQGSKRDPLLVVGALPLVAVGVVIVGISWLFGSSGDESTVPSERNRTRRPSRPTTVHDLSLEKRKEIFQAVVLAEDRAQLDATKRLGEPSTINEIRRHQRLYLEFRKENLRGLVHEHGVSADVLQKITVEGIANKWRLP